MADDGDALYDKCAEVALNSREKWKKVFTQDNVLALCKEVGLDKLFDLATLLPVVQRLVDRNLFIPANVKSSKTAYWQVRPRDAAKQMQKLNQEERVAYTAIEASHTSGMWIRSIRKQTNLTDQALNKITEKLCKLRMIKSVKNIKAPAQKTFMLYGLNPDDAVTGGSFYDGGELDEALVASLADLVVFHMRQGGWVDEKRKVKREFAEAVTADAIEDGRGASPEEERGRKGKGKRLRTNDIEDAGPARKARRRERDEHETVQISHEPGHEYPDAKTAHDWIIGLGIIRAAKAVTLTVDEIQNIINMLVWDEKLEPINNGYRTVRGVPAPTMGEQVDDDLGSAGGVSGRLLGRNGLTEMPCGHCPVMGVCGKGGPISADNCVYWDEWLGKALDAHGERAGMEVEIVG